MGDYEFNPYLRFNQNSCTGFLEPSGGIQSNGAIFFFFREFVSLGKNAA